MAKFCPECGKATIKIQDGDFERDACPDPDCKFVEFAKTKIGVGAMIVRNGKFLVVERGIRPVGLWTLISGHLEQHETLMKQSSARFRKKLV